IRELESSKLGFERKVRNLNANLYRDNSCRKGDVEELARTRARLQHLFDVSPIVIYSSKTSGDYEVTFISKNIKEQMGYEPDEFIEDPRFWYTRIHPDDVERILEEVSNVLKRGFYSYEYRFLHKNSDYRWVHDEMRLVLDENGAPFKIVGYWLDITEHKKAIKALQESEVRYRNIFQNALVSLWENDLSEVRAAVDRLKSRGIENFRKYLDENPDFIKKASEMIKVLDVNDMALKLYGAVTKKELLGPLDKFIEKIGALESLSLIKEEIIAIAEGKKYIEHEVMSRTLHGDRLDLLVNLTIPPDKEKYTNMLISAVDITKRKKAEEELRKSENLYKTLIENLPLYIYQKNLNSFYVTCNNNFADINNIKISEVPGKTDYDFYPKELAERYREIDNRIFSTGETINIEDTYPSDNGKEQWVQTVKSPLRDETGKISGVLGISWFITDRIEAARKIENSLKEKEILLNEIHHRVKNNLQVISGLLDLQSKNIRNKEMKAAFKVSQNRIKTISMIHEQLYKSKNFSEIDLRKYITDLSSHLFKSYGDSAGSVSMDINIEDIYLNLNTIIPIGLIITEAVTNALKHAFSGNKRGAIIIDLRIKQPGTYLLDISDNGTGMKTDFNIDLSDSIGLKLIKMIATHQLKGTFQFEHKNGVRIMISFTEKEYKVFS
ncbi:MAG TPA: PAS domain S-box protein, partial [Spirochaetes bacterium]|nr:PAS domain S-box protein [Spirochaetota bacterium]